MNPCPSLQNLCPSTCQHSCEHEIVFRCIGCTCSTQAGIVSLSNVMRTSGTHCATCSDQLPQHILARVVMVKSYTNIYTLYLHPGTVTLTISMTLVCSFAAQGQVLAIHSSRHLMEDISHLMPWLVHNLTTSCVLVSWLATQQPRHCLLCFRQGHVWQRQQQWAR